MAGKLEGKVALITGGASGIGLAIARRYAQEGARVCIADIEVAEAERMAVDIGQQAFAVQVDVSSLESIEHLVEQVVTYARGIDILVNNAGVVEIAPFLEVTQASYDRIFAVNTKGLFFMLQTVARQMVRQGRGGKIINFASQAGRRGEALVSAYCASKAAVISITQSAALALIPHRINVNGIAPGVVDTPMWDKLDRMFARYENLQPGEKKRIVGEHVPYGRMGLPGDHVGAAVFLASSDSDYVVAQTLNVDGGNWMN